MSISSLIKSLAALAFLTLVSGSAMAAVDAAKVAELIKAKMALSNLTLESAAAELSGTNVILKAAKITAAGGAAPLELGDLTLENVSEQGEGYFVQKLAVQPYENAGADFKTQFKGGSISNIQLQPVKADDPMSPFMMYESAEMAGLEVTENGVRVFGIGPSTATMSPYKPGEKVDFTMTMNEIYGNFTSAKSPEMKKTMGDLGYSEITGKVIMKGNWDPKDGRMAVPEFSYDFNNVGKLNIAFDISGYTAQFAKQLQDMSKTASDQQGMAMMGLFSQLTFNGMSIRFDDASITNKIIDYLAKTSNQPREAIVAQGKGMAPMMAMALQDATLIQKVSEAVGAFLDSPKNLEIKAAPEQPISFAVLAASGMSAPAQLAKQLGLTITANQ